MKIDFPQIEVKFLDILSDDVEKYNDILKMVDSGLVTLPITLLNELPRFHGGLNYEEIKEIILEK